MPTVRYRGPRRLNRWTYPSLSRPELAVERAEDVERLQSALNRLTPEHRVVLVLKEIEGQKYDEIAAILQVPIGTIRSRLHRARVELRDKLAENPID